MKVETGTAADCQEEHDSIENIYQWEIAYGSIGNGTEAAYHPYDDGYDADRIDEFIKNYLEEQGIRKTDPDGIVYNRRGEPFVEYYIEESEKKYCFVVHLWGNYWIDYETGVSAYQDAVYCTTHTVQETDWTGTLIYNIDEENNSTRERLYDTEEMQMETDEEGRIIRYNGSHEFPKDQKPWAEGEFMLDAYFSEPCTFVYDESGRMICNEYYITHGGHTDIFLYEGDAQRPWACLNWCSFAPGFTNVSLFLEQ